MFGFSRSAMQVKRSELSSELEELSTLIEGVQRALLTQRQTLSFLVQKKAKVARTLAKVDWFTLLCAALRCTQLDQQMSHGSAPTHVELPDAGDSSDSATEGHGHRGSVLEEELARIGNSISEMFSQHPNASV